MYVYVCVCVCVNAYFLSGLPKLVNNARPRDPTPKRRESMLKSSNEAKEIEILPSRGFYFSCQRPVKEMSAVSSILKTYSEIFFFRDT